MAAVLLPSKIKRQKIMDTAIQTNKNIPEAGFRSLLHPMGRRGRFAFLFLGIYVA